MSVNKEGLPRCRFRGALWPSSSAGSGGRKLQCFSLYKKTCKCMFSLKRETVTRNSVKHFHVISVS